MSDIVIGVVADTRRDQQAWALYDTVDAKVISFDSGTIGATKNHIRVWTKLLQHGGNWAVVLEDDAVPVDGFTDQLVGALADPPANIVGLYLGKGYPKAWQRFVKKATSSETANYVMSSHLLHGVGTAIRMHLVEDMLRCIKRITPVDWPMDEQITRWARLRGERVCYTLPSLVDHADGPTLLVHPDSEGRAAPRVAYRTGRRPVWDKTKVVGMP
jgi:GR25 family glycosyltransferase involved in LPS biosynthesis